MAATSSLWQPFLDRAKAVILDGGLATELERRGADLDDPLWSAKLLIENPQLIREVHADYFQAGADVGTSASYQASFEGFAHHGLNQQQAADLMRLSVRLVKEARDRFWDDPSNRAERVRPLVAASVGCYGASLADGSEYRGDYGLTVGQLIDWHRPRLEVLAESGADLLACETIPCLEEAEALVRLLAEIPKLPAWISFSCRDAVRLCHGEPLVEAVRMAQTSPNVIAVGVNCTAPRVIDDVLRTARPAATVPLLVYPNSGETWNAERRAWEAEPQPLDWGEAARRWRDAGARLIGGCCRTTPATIRDIAMTLRG